MKKPKNPKPFIVGHTYKAINFNTGKLESVTILFRKGNWVKVDVSGIVHEIRVGIISQPPSESINIPDLSPVFSYQTSSSGEGK